MGREKRFWLRNSDIRKAARLAYADQNLVARPISWRNSGYGLVAHGGSFYRVHGNEEMKPYQLCVLEIIEGWEVIRRSQLQEEIDGTYRAERERDKKKRVFAKPDGSRGSGRPSKQEVTAMFDGMLCIDDAAVQCGVANHALRRAIIANKLPWLKQHGVYLVSLEDVKKWRDGPKGPRKKNVPEETQASYY